MISAFSGKQAGKHVVHIACGSTYSAAITAEGELYTWGRGNYGRLGHGMSTVHDYSHEVGGGCKLLRGIENDSCISFKAPVKMRPFQCWWQDLKD